MTAAMKQGQMFSVDVLFNVSYHARLVPSNAEAENAAEEAYGAARDRLMLRFESPHLQNPLKEGTEWYIADIDNFYTAKVRKEEEPRSSEDGDD